jgi:arabinose-5-phosphate isomerase
MDAAFSDGSPSADDRLSQFEMIRYAREIISAEANALVDLGGRLSTKFCDSADLILGCRGSVIVSGMGKAGLIGQKIAATMASTGTRSHFLHPAEAFHGDLGRVHRDDVVLILSQSGETEEVTRLLPSLSELNTAIIAMTASRNSTLGRAANVTLELGPLKEACSLGLAPSTSTTVMLAYGDALALVVSRMRSFGPEDFARFHPGGSLGRQLSKVDDHMRGLDECRVASHSESVRSVLVAEHKPGRRTGAIMLVDDRQRLTGIFTDSDLARLFETRRESALDQSIESVMTANPISIASGTLVQDALAVLAERKISELPVVDTDRRPIGMLDITDLVNRNFIKPTGAEVHKFKPRDRSA